MYSPILYDIYCLMSLGVRLLASGLWDGHRPLPWAEPLTLSWAVLASASLGLLFRCHEDLLRCFTRVRKPWFLRDAGLRRTGKCSATGDVRQHQGNDVAGRIQG